MNKKWLIIGIISVSVIGTLGYLYYRKKKKTNKKTNNDKSDSQPVKLNQSPQVDKNSQAVKITEKKLSQFNDTLSHYEYKNNSLYDKDTGSKISENAGWAVWGLLYRNYNSLLSGVNNDKSINKETKDYSLNVLTELKKTLDKRFPPEIYNTSSKLFKKYNLDKIKEVNIYNETI